MTTQERQAIIEQLPFDLEAIYYRMAEEESNELWRLGVLQALQEVYLDHLQRNNKKVLTVTP